MDDWDETLRIAFIEISRCKRAVSGAVSPIVVPINPGTGWAKVGPAVVPLDAAVLQPSATIILLKSNTQVRRQARRDVSAGGCTLRRTRRRLRARAAIDEIIDRTIRVPRIFDIACR